MEDKMFELMTKMYSEFSEFRKETNEKFETVENHILRLENKLEYNSKALFDGYKQVYEKVSDIETKVEDIYLKLDKQDVEIRVIKGGVK